MRRLFLLACLGFSALFASAQITQIKTKNLELVLSTQKGEKAKQIYFGEKLSANDLKNIESVENGQEAYPVYGMNCPQAYALSAKHADGNLTLDMLVESVESISKDNSNITKVHLKDKFYPFYVNLCYQTYNDADIIEVYTEIFHNEKKSVVLNDYLSACLWIRNTNDVWASHLYGSWANEGRLIQEKLNPGILQIKNKDGVRNSHTSHGEIMFSLDGKPQENQGRTIGAAVCYWGNYELNAVVHDDDYIRFFAGICSENSAYTLAKDEIFTTPKIAFTFSNQGLSGVSRNYHQWARNHKLAHGNQERMILLNSWEGVYFNINQEGMDQMMHDIASMGGELFVMDDGWFGDKYPRSVDNSSLGDWVVDKKKLPNGIEGLVSDAKKNGVKFGIWIEPEMANTVSELYEKHPDWIIKASNREPVLGRGGTQVVLDMANPQVQDFVFKIVDDLMSKYPEIAYIKWDANMSIMNHGSQYLSKDNQEKLYIEYHRGLEKVCQRIRAKYPDLIIQACASGGGRASYGLMEYFDEFWVSDNTDALQRVYMQWGTSYFFPSIAMASHISAAPNHQTFRTIPLKYRIDVAMSGRLGMEIQPKNMTEEEKQLCKNAIADYKMIRPIVQFGDIYRLLSPYDNKDLASLMYVSNDKSKAVFYWWKLETYCNQLLPRVKMAGLNPDKNYTIKELNRIDNKPLSFEGKSFSGKYLMENGLEIPYSHIVDYHKQNDWSSRVLYLEVN